MTSFFSEYELVAQSPWFDSRFYLDRNPDVVGKGMDPVLHYLEIGARNGRPPHPDFDIEFYRGQCAERGLNGINNPLLHFIQQGEALGLKPCASAPARRRTDEQEWMLQRILDSGLFDRQFYNAAYGLRFESDTDALRHFYFEGYKEGKRPNLYFDPAWYLSTYADLRAAGVQPLFHYLVAGDAEGRQPSLIFNASWYRAQYQIPKDGCTIAHYLKNARGGRFSPLPDFDVEYYLTVNKDVRDAGVDAFEHFLFTGFREGRNPSAAFNIRYYVQRYLAGKLESNPFLHYLQHKHEPGVYGAPPEDEASAHRAIRQFTKPAAEFEEFRALQPTLTRRAKVLAYYLPQFHAFPENDRWWGKGFTEWNNVARGVSRFKSHYQPRIPRDLGFYSLEDALPTLRRQVEMAKGGGVHGFVFYYYWFNGKRLLERPIEQFLGAPDIDMPYCLMWANENWTRRWDGDEHEVLISQDYDPDDDDRLIDDFVRHFRDARYIRVAGRPLLMIYRPGIIPDARKTIARLRTVFAEKHGENPILVMAQAFNDYDPTVFGLDGAIEFPPHKITAGMSMINDSLDYLDVEFTGQVFNYDDVVARSLQEPTPAFPLIKTAAPSWDNDARRQGTGLVMHGSTPAKYEAWMRELIDRAQVNRFFGERIVCVNAWNEWCEAAYLEPDLHYGAAYLNATARAVAGLSAGSQTRLLLVGHDAFPSGAQHLLLNIARRLAGDHGLQPEILLLSGGALQPAYEDVAPVTVAGDTQALLAYLKAARDKGIRNAIVNTVAAAHVLPLLRDHEIEATTLVHELPRVVREKHLQAGARAAFELSRHAVFASRVVRDQLAAELEIEPDERTHIMPQGMYQQLDCADEAVVQLRRDLGMDEDGKLVLGMGYADLRKGFDLFLQLWRLTNRSCGGRVHFCWVGDIDPGLKGWLATELEDATAAGTFHLTGYRQNVAPFLHAASAFALTSREDPFPTVVHEALTAGLPVFAFDASGGMPDFLVQHAMGTVVPHGDAIAMAEALTAELQSAPRPQAREARQAFARTTLDFGRYVDRLLHLAMPQLAPVSVAVPNYNYAQFMPERLGTIFQQSYPVEEVLVLDDCSTDDSLDVIPRVASDWGRRITLLPNKRNSGSVFAQWRKAAETARGELLWIAEADDLSDPGFLAAVVGAMQADPSICLGFSDSRAIQHDGSPLWDSYKDYYAQLEPGALAASEVFDGDEFVRRFLAVRNLILNVSAVVWRRAALLQALDACEADLREFRMAGDWRLYLEAMVQPGAKVAYVSDPLNVHRRHASSVTHALKADKHVAEIARCHTLAAKGVQLPASTRQTQAKYLESVRVQLGATPQAARQPRASAKARSNGRARPRKLGKAPA